LVHLCKKAAPSKQSGHPVWKFASQGCQIVDFQTKNQTSGLCILEDLGMETFGIFQVIRCILKIFGIRYDHLVLFVIIWYICSSLGTSKQGKSGNPVANRELKKLVQWS
jgi:hypothetical protein